MNASYADLLNTLGYPSILFNIAEGRVRVPNFTIDAPANLSVRYPPMLIPLWSNSGWPGYIGLAKHWFGLRSDSYVEYYAEEDAIREVATNMEQLKAWLAFDFLSNGPDSAAVGRFAESIELCPGDRVEEYFKDCRDIPDLKKLQVYSKDPPEVLQGINTSGTPKWVGAFDAQKIKELISKGEYERAWYATNSPIWDPEEVSEILKLLEPHAADSRFGLLVECWMRFQT